MRYDDYIKIIPTQLHAVASSKKTEYWQAISGRHYWTSIVEKLEKEDEAKKRAKANGQDTAQLSSETPIALSPSPSVF